MGFPRQDYWSGLPFPSPGDLPDPGIEPESSAGVFFTTELPGKPCHKWPHGIINKFVILLAQFIQKHLDCFHVLDVVNSAMKMKVEISLLDDNFISFRCILRSIFEKQLYFFFFFKKQLYSFPQKLHQFTFASVVNKFPFLHLVISTSCILPCL